MKIELSWNEITKKCNDILEPYIPPSLTRSYISYITESMIFNLYRTDGVTLITNIDEMYIQICNDELDNLIIKIFQEMDII